MYIAPEILKALAKKMRHLQLVEAGDHEIWGACFSPNSQVLAFSTDDYMVHFRNVAAPEAISPPALSCKTYRGFNLGYLPDGGRLAIRGSDYKVHVWDLFSGTELIAPISDTVYLRSMSLSSDGKYIATGNADGDLSLWDAYTGGKISSNRGHTGSVWALAFSPDGRGLASGAGDGSVKLWLDEGELTVRRVIEHQQPIATMAFSPSGDQLAFSLMDGTIRIWDRTTDLIQDFVTADQSLARKLVWHRDGGILISLAGRSPNSVQFWHPQSGEVIWTFPQGLVRWHTRVLDISADGQLLAMYVPDSLKQLALMDISSFNLGKTIRLPMSGRRNEEVQGFAPQIDLQLSTLPLHHANAPSQSRPAFWLQNAGAVGVNMPLCIAYDLGALLVQPRDQLVIARPEYLPEDRDTANYLDCLTRLADHPVLRELSRWAISDAVVGIVLAKLVVGIELPSEYKCPTGTVGIRFARWLAKELEEASEEALWRNASDADRPDLNVLLKPHSIAQIETNLRKLDLDELRFLHQYGPRFTGAPDPREMLDLFTLLDLPPAVRLTLSQVLRLIPRISETVSIGGTQVYAVGGYEGLSRKGSFDSLVPTELGYPDEVFVHRLMNNEALYYGREAEREKQRELVYIITQVGLGMLGDADLAVRALTLALGQAMQRRNYEVVQSFIGSQWTPPHRIDRPGDMYRILYHQDKEKVKPSEMLRAVLEQLQSWRNQFRKIHLIWAIGEHWDQDEWDTHVNLYRAIRKESELQAWFVRVGKKTSAGRYTRPAVAEFFSRFQVLDSEVMWRQAEGQPAFSPLIETVTPDTDDSANEDQELSRAVEIVKEFLHREVGTVKWYDATKGYGFITRANGEDVFFHHSEIRPEGYKTPKEGQRVLFSISAGPNGPALDVVVAGDEELRRLNVEEKFKQIVADQLGIDKSEIVPEARFVEEFGADSLDLVEIVMRVEEEFNMEIPDEDAQRVTIVREAVDYLFQHTRPLGISGL